MVAGEAHAHVEQRVGERADGGRVRRRRRAHLRARVDAAADGGDAEVAHAREEVEVGQARSTERRDFIAARLVPKRSAYAPTKFRGAARRAYPNSGPEARERPGDEGGIS